MRIDGSKPEIKVWVSREVGGMLCSVHALTLPVDGSGGLYVSPEVASEMARLLVTAARSTFPVRRGSDAGRVYCGQGVRNG